MLDRRTVLELFLDRYYAPYFPSRAQHDGVWEWNIAGIGLVIDEEMADLVVAAQPPIRGLYNHGWWQRLTGQSVPEDESEIRARHHIWVIRQQCLGLLANRHQLLQGRFRGLSLLSRLLKEGEHAPQS